jgi:hypothetical protein
MPDEFTPEEKKLFAEEPTDAAVFVGEGEPSAEDADNAAPADTAQQGEPDLG